LEKIMKVVIRKMGNSHGVIIPKPVLAQAGLVSEAEMRVEKGAIVLEKPSSAPRTGWAEASKKLATTGDDELVWPELGSETDKDLQW
jgi:antitoxin MazE